MNYLNAKKGFRLLFAAEILMIISNVGFILPENLALLGVAISLLSIVAFFMNLKGIKLCAKDAEGYARAYQFVIIGIVVSIVEIVISGLCSEAPWFAQANLLLRTLEQVAELMVAYYIFKTSIELLRQKGDEKFAASAQKTMDLYITFSALGIALCTVNVDVLQAIGVGVLLAFIFGGVVEILLLAIAQIKYYIFLGKMCKAL